MTSSPNSNAIVIPTFRWALVKDVEVAKRMIKFIELNTIGVSKDSQLRAAKVLEVVSNSCEQAGGSEYAESFFHFSHALMTERWRLLREAVKHSGLFSLPNFSSAHCSFFDNNLGTQPGKNNNIHKIFGYILVFSLKIDCLFCFILCSFCMVKMQSRRR